MFTEFHKITTHSADETRGLGLRLAAHLTPGTILGLEGELGAGKTTLIQGICGGLGINEKVVSPTFVLMHLYNGKLPVYHFDLYRLEQKDLADLGWDDYLTGKGVCLIEWVGRSGSALPYPHLHLKIDYGTEPDLRTFTFQPHNIDASWLPLLAEKTQTARKEGESVV